MGKLIDPERRQRAKRQREERKARILRVARSTFSRLPFVEVTLDSIGQAADVDRGVASMYFRTREELFLLLLRDELGEWYVALETALERASGGMSRSEFVDLVAESLCQRPVLTRLLSFEAIVLEQNLDAMEAFKYQRWRRDRMAEVGCAIDRTVDGFKDGAGVRLLFRTQLVTAALQPAANPKGAATYEVGDPDFAIFAIDFETELKNALLTMMEASTSSGATF